ncbi:MAG: alpha-ketoglutarate-dependent dioxygenase AlkB [Flavobacterium sp.]|nr:MAG: alpha-ketoglutarate-dependent dioxygenase AlkB [Flavobacterium sp.]
MGQLSLFSAEEFYDFPKDLLEFREHFLTANESDLLFSQLLENAPWKQRTQTIYDKKVLTPRLTAWYGDSEKSYQLGGSEFEVNAWTPELLSLKNKIQETFGYEFNSVLLNLYRDNNDSVAWHRDKESRYDDRPVIASLSLGQTRKFDFRKLNHHESKYSIPLPHGSLLLMKGDLQEHWEHRIAKSNLLMKERINLTFRLVREL